MGLWSFYFLAKLYLYLQGYLAFHAWPNALLLAYLTLPWWWQRRQVPRAVWAAHGILGAALAAALLWHDSYFPSFASSVEFIANPATRPTPAYVGSFISGYWHPAVAAVLAGLLAAAVLAHRRQYRLAPFILLLMAVPAAQNASRTLATAGDETAEFYAAQADAKLAVRFDPPAAGARPFDIVLLHVCSMSWDDLKQVGLENHPFFSQFDLLLTRFNTVTAYSNPATLRLLRAPCGQTSHGALYEDAPAECYLMDQLRHAGYASETVFNHRGKYSDSMADEGRRLAHAAAPLDLGTLPVEAVSFDDSTVLNNFLALEAWWKQRLASGTPRAALYYNTVTLHAGVHDPKDPNSSKRDPVAVYKETALRIFADLTRFMKVMEAANRDVLVVMVPEHGGALVGNRMQARDLRDIPLPKITLAPVGFKFIGNGKGKLSDARPPVRIDSPTSYRAIAHLLSAALRSRRSTDSGTYPEAAIASVPTTPFLSENERARVVTHDGAYFFEGKDRLWTKIPDNL